MADGVRVGADVGGTFTDVVAVADGRVRVTKTPSTPDAPERGVVDGLERVADRDAVDPGDVSAFAHGTTVATNAVLEAEWADAALVTTEGFRDVLEIGRQARPDIYDFQAEKPTPVVERDRRFGVPERLDEQGAVLEPLDEDAVRALAADLRAAGVESVAVCLLFAFENDAHERRVREILRAEGLDVPCSLSSVVLPEIREYERTLTTALDAALKPVLADYVGRLTDAVADAGVRAPLRIMQSNGGTITAEAARDRPVRTLLSGPAAGVQGATYVAGRRGFDDLLTMDMGGTSCDVSLVTDGDPVVTTDVEVGEYPVSVPMTDVHTVGAGGGSVAWLDPGGALRVGPRSAGADPGPVCYGRGGDRPTTTDAQFLLGRIDPESFLDGGGASRAEVREVVERELADPLGLGVDAAAQGVLDVANANMERALRVVSVERGYDPREFTLVAFGGAGPLHAATLAADLDVPRVLVPRAAGVLSALGLLTSDVLYDYSTSRVRRLSAVDPGDLSATFEEFVAAGRDRLAAEDVPPDRMTFERTADLRYVGQSFDLGVRVPASLDADALEAVAERFHRRHRDRYGHASPSEPLELVTLRCRARGTVEPPDLAAETTRESVEAARTGTREVGFDGAVRETPTFDRARLGPGMSLDGPAVVEGAESTTVVPPGQHLRVDDDANLLLEVST
jgi:N-methylhydantoinase A